MKVTCNLMAWCKIPLSKRNPFLLIGFWFPKNYNGKYSKRNKLETQFVLRIYISLGKISVWGRDASKIFCFDLHFFIFLFYWHRSVVISDIFYSNIVLYKKLPIKYGQVLYLVNCCLFCLPTFFICTFSVSLISM